MEGAPPLAGASSVAPYARIDRLLPALALGAAVAVALLKLPCGVFWPDEGFYLASGHRLLLGDRPFADEVSYATSWFFVVLTPILSVLPQGGTLVQVRLVGFAVRLVCAAALFLTFRRGLTWAQTAAGLGVSILAGYPGLLVPNYNSLPFDLGFVSLAFWCQGLRDGARRAAGWGALGGLALGASILCYLPRLALLAVPAAVLLWAWRTRARSLTWATVSLLASAVAVLAASTWWLVAQDLREALAAAIWFQAASPALSTAPLARLLGLLRTEAARALPSALVHLLFVAAALGASSSRRAPRAAAALVAVAYGALLLGLYASRGDLSVPVYALVYTGLCWLPLLVYPALRRRLRETRPELAVPALLLFLLGGAQQAIVAVTSTQAAAAGIPGLAPSLLLLLLLWNALPPAPAARPAADVALYGFCACLGLTAAGFHFYPEQNPLRTATLVFESGRLRGIRSGERFVRGWTAIADGLGPRVRRGELLLAYENIPMLYYLTDTRPALGATYVSSFVYEPRQQQALLDTMIRRGRIPRYAVRLMEGTPDEYTSPSYSRRPEVDPINAYVLEHYALEVLYPPFEVFRHRATP